MVVAVPLSAIQHVDGKQRKERFDRIVGAEPEEDRRQQQDEALLFGGGELLAEAALVF